jgi:hypothetical protein
VEVVKIYRVKAGLKTKKTVAYYLAHRKSGRKPVFPESLGMAKLLRK